MRLHLSIILVLLMFFAAAREALIVLGFNMNRAQIAATLCVEKDKVQTTCAGACWLADQLDQDETKKTGSAPGLPLIQLQELHLPPLKTSWEYVRMNCERNLVSIIPNLASDNLYRYRLFRPPIGGQRS